jgi:hypothetical protein
MLAALSAWKPALIGLAALAIVAAVGGFFGVYQHTLTRNQELAAQAATQAQAIDQATAANAAAAAALAQQQRLHSDDLAAIAAAHQEAAAAADRIHALEKETDLAPATDDGPIAPLARRGLGRLRDLATAGDPHKSERRAGGDPAGTAPALPAARAPGG